jgi:hypothetical protein
MEGVKSGKADDYDSVLGCGIAWKLRKQSKLEWLSSNRTQKGLQFTPISKVVQHATPARATTVIEMLGYDGWSRTRG